MKRSLMIAAAAGCVTGFGGLAMAQQAAAPAPAAVVAAEPEIDAFEYVMAAHTVAEFARRERDPQAYIIAARMLQQVPFQDSAPAAPDAAGPAAFTAEGLLAEAKVLAKGDPALLMQINIAQSGSRGVALSAFGKGLVRIVQLVGGKTTYAFGIKAKGGELLRIGAIGDPKTRISMRLRDAKGKVVCSDDPGDSAPVCSVRPAVAGDYRVEVLNQTATPTRAVILSN